MDLDELKEKKLQELKSQKQEGEEEKQKKKQLELQKKRLLKKILTSDARSRLANLRAAKPQFVERVEMQLIQIARTGRVELPINDEQLKKLLKKLQNKRDFNIERR
ncbi:MAG: DNA-binding protein [Hadesarchaea archaeon]|nr:DNA-binding protein [Hadesarchaea archaeon]